MTGGENFVMHDGGDRVDADDGVDEIRLGAGNDRSYGDEGVDDSYGAGGNDRMFGNRGDDKFTDDVSGGYYNPDHDYVCGGDGTDNRTDLQDGDESDIFWGQDGTNDTPIAAKDPGDLAYEGDQFDQCSTL